MNTNMNSKDEWMLIASKYVKQNEKGEHYMTGTDMMIAIHEYDELQLSKLKEAQDDFERAFKKFMSDNGIHIKTEQGNIPVKSYLDLNDIRKIVNNANSYILENDEFVSEKMLFREFGVEIDETYKGWNRNKLIDFIMFPIADEENKRILTICEFVNFYDARNYKSIFDDDMVKNLKETLNDCLTKGLE